ncbi:CDP-diacylglycerol--serine O-phosphatidyltransferase [Saccharophagus sp. K07]|uniref:CDP-diacylglycerol--serine O-phosphatidyltransferase n=1 Tax=Saccharophagus sp. K07 TaxID=2283636 RepID=UPI001651BEF4|nr:CDP-diacylglycerol--serine O-phosphatidyltransferase [Saccharophagus sp. K07]MBC6905772.1 CDP-diacylglycerol--serine O-phosphatidyltransferase [Saccharophagus sp. K07]
MNKTSGDDQQDNPLLNIVDEHEEEVVTSTGQKERHKGVYLLPNLFTTAALFAGFYAIISGMKGNFEAAGLAIIVAQLMDGFDGRIARLTNTTSAFGVQYDSLSDMVSFGLAPSLVIFSWGLEPLGKFGWAAAFLFAACAALRLARFNTQVETVDKRYFVGLASPPAAAILATTVWLWHDVVPPYEVSVLVGILTVVIGLLMVSNIRYTSFKGFNLRGRVPFVVMLAALLVFIIVVINPPTVLLAMACIYCLSGPVMWLLAYRKSVVTTGTQKPVEDVQIQTEKKDEKNS